MALTDDEQRQRRESLRDLMPTTPFIKSLGIVIERFEPDEASVRLPFRAELTNDGTSYHGGVIASVLDTCGALAAWSNHDFDKGMRASTVSMAVNYIGAARACDLLCSARALKRGRELIFTDIHATDTGGNLVAQAVQTYRIV